jgi:hypothetical protein
MDMHHSGSESFMVLPIVSTGSPLPSLFGGAWYTEGLTERYVDAPFPKLTDYGQLRHDFHTH